MKKEVIALTFFLILLLSLPGFSIAGSSDVWLVCDSTKSGCSASGHNKTIGSTNYYCCWVTSEYKWQTSNCDYCSCTRNNPTVRIIPYSQSGTRGQTLTYTVNVTNNDNNPCGSSTFNLTVTQCPSGTGWSFTCNLATDQLTISPGSSATTSISVTSSYSAPYDVYEFKVKATNNAYTNYYGERNASYELTSGGGGTTTTTTLTTTSTTTTTTTPACNNNGKCDPQETQSNCPNDCKTVVSIYPSQSYPSQTVKVTVYFNDSRFNTAKKDYDANVTLTIDGQYWDPSYCPINGKKWRSDMKCGMSGGGWSCSGNKCSKVYEGKNVVIVTEMGYGYIEAECVIPPGLSAGSHTLTAIPTIYSEPITLRAAEVEIKIGDGLYTFVLIVKRIFSRITGSFVYK